MQRYISFIVIILAAASIAHAQHSRFTTLHEMIDSMGISKTISILDSTMQILFNSTPDTIHEQEIWIYCREATRPPAHLYSSSVESEISYKYMSNYLRSYNWLWRITLLNNTSDSLNYVGQCKLTDSNGEVIYDYVLCPSNTNPLPDITIKTFFDTINHQPLFIEITKNPRTLIPNPKLETQFKQMKTAYNTWISIFYKEGLAEILRKKIPILPDGYTWEEF